jgi:hypothetical protein
MDAAAVTTATATPTKRIAEEEEEEEMKPWEQHSGVIRLPRFDYNAPSSLLTHSHSAFLITCTISTFSLFSISFIHVSSLIDLVSASFLRAGEKRY